METNYSLYPKISVVTPNFNGAKYLEETIRSVLEQQYPNLEYIIIDGNSTDDSLKIIRKYEKQLFYFISEKDEGMYDAINKGFDVSTGEIMTYINSDDTLLPNSLFAIAQIFRDLEEVNWIQGRSLTMNDKSYFTSPGHLHRSTIYDYMIENGKWISQDGTFWRRSLWNKIGAKINSKYKLAGDFDLFSHFFLYSELYSTNNIFSAFRHHANQLHQLFFREYIKEVREIIREKNYPESLKKEQKRIHFISSLLTKIPGLRNTEYVRNKITKLYKATPMIYYNLFENKFKLDE